jgi:hypothetical protein
VPPLAVSGFEYAVPAAPEGSDDDVVIASTGGATTSDRVTDLAVCCGLDESVTEKVKLLVPIAVGVPEITPVDAAKLSPAGRVPEASVQVYGLMPPVAFSVVL